ncbi:hypothetical protein ACH4UM_34615 [Streptomyces sp. NPDC020801]|uniref:hypothetical protein n=1 Tax=unclassified Streptomyces TaxID=2593676 RepID=UPI00379C735C
MSYPTAIDENAPVVADHTILLAAPLERVRQLHTRIGSCPAGSLPSPRPGSSAPLPAPPSTG